MATSNAINRLLAGPAAATSAYPVRDPCRNFHGLTGTGFAQPNPTKRSSMIPAIQVAQRIERQPAQGGGSVVTQPVRDDTCANSWMGNATNKMTALAKREGG